MRNDVERTNVGEVLSAEAEREDVGIERFAEAAQERRLRGDVVLRVDVAEVDLAVEVADAVSAVDAEAVVVAVAVGLRVEVAHGVRISGTDVHSCTDNGAARSNPVKAEDSTVLMLRN